MVTNGLSGGFVVSIVWAGLASGQTLPTAARIEAVPLELTMPERYQVAEVLEPIRRITLIAPSDGTLRSTEARLGAMVRESQEIAELDRTETAARLKMATAELREKQALLKSNKTYTEVYQAQLDAAQARVEIAQLELDRCTLRAPFSGMITALPVSTGQYVLKGTIIAELADISSLKALQPVDRRTATVGSSLNAQIEGREVAAKVQAILPLPEKFARLRELATPLSAGFLIVSNTKGDLEPGLRLHAQAVPSRPLAAVPRRALKPTDAKGGTAATVQVIRAEYVVNVPVQVLGDTTPERVQIAGALRTDDSLVVASSVPLLEGTLVRFGEGAATATGEGAAAGSTGGGADAGVTGPSNPRSRPTAPAAAPRGPGSVPNQKPAPPQGSGANPF
jgi:multidrug efflux pump subunit AcrA (membrane-fusion protein)